MRVLKIQPQNVIWVVLLCLPLLTGCGEVLNEYYISNHTDVSLTIKLTPRYIDTVDLNSGPLIEDIRNSARGSLPQPVSFDPQGEVVQFTLPAKTTVYLGFSSGGNDLFSQLEVSSENRRTVMSGDDYRNYFAVHDNFVGAVVHVFNVK